MIINGRSAALCRGKQRMARHSNNDVSIGDSAPTYMAANNCGGEISLRRDGVEGEIYTDGVLFIDEREA